MINNTLFTVNLYLPLNKTIFTHHLNDNPGGTITITHQVEMIRIKSPIFAFIIVRRIKASLPDAMNKLFKLAESKSLISLRQGYVGQEG